MFFGGNDPYIPMADIEKVQGAPPTQRTGRRGRGVPGADHVFMRDGSESYDPDRPPTRVAHARVLRVEPHSPEPASREAEGHDHQDQRDRAEQVESRGCDVIPCCRDRAPNCAQRSRRRSPRAPRTSSRSPPRASTTAIISGSRRLQSHDQRGRCRTTHRAGKKHGGPRTCTRGGSPRRSERRPPLPGHERAEVELGRQPRALRMLPTRQNPRGTAAPAPAVPGTRGNDSKRFSMVMPAITSMCPRAPAPAATHGRCGAGSGT